MTCDRCWLVRVAVYSVKHRISVCNCCCFDSGFALTSLCTCCLQSWCRCSAGCWCKHLSLQLWGIRSNDAEVLADLARAQPDGDMVPSGLPSSAWSPVSYSNIEIRMSVFLEGWGGSWCLLQTGSAPLEPSTSFTHISLTEFNSERKIRFVSGLIKV